MKLILSDYNMSVLRIMKLLEIVDTTNSFYFIKTILTSKFVKLLVKLHFIGFKRMFCKTLRNFTLINFFKDFEQAFSDCLWKFFL